MKIGTKGTHTIWIILYEFGEKSMLWNPYFTEESQRNFGLSSAIFIRLWQNLVRKVPIQFVSAGTSLVKIGGVYSIV